MSAKRSLALATSDRLFDLAYRWAPGDAHILSRRSEALAATAKTKEDWSKAADAARRSVLRDPLNPGAIVILGAVAGLHGDNRRAEQLFAYSQAISRRDLKTSLWEIEQAVARGDVPGALHQYDVALRTSRQAQDVLFPVLSAAIAQPNIREELANTLSRPSSQVWAVPFVRAVATTGPDYVAAADLFARLRRRGVRLPEGTEASVLGALVASGKYDIAWSHAASIEKGWSRDRSRDPRFLRPGSPPSPFDWNPINDTGLSATVQRGTEGGAFTFSAVAGAGGVVLRQLQLLPPGTYRINSRLTALSPPGAAPFWTVRCVDGAEVTRVELVVARSRQPALSAPFPIAANCPAQWLDLSMPPTDEVGGSTGVVDLAALVPVKAAAK